MSDALNEREKSLSQSEIERIQRVLKEFGAAVTDTFDVLTREAIKRWQNADV
ncbi:MAG TPA: peptidoglycan-binding domain-containing protein [Steroidobacteraceae bacterium]